MLKKLRLSYVTSVVLDSYGVVITAVLAHCRVGGSLLCCSLESYLLGVSGWVSTAKPGLSTWLRWRLSKVTTPWLWRQLFPVSVFWGCVWEGVAGCPHELGTGYVHACVGVLWEYVQITCVHACRMHVECIVMFCGDVYSITVLFLFPIRVSKYTLHLWTQTITLTLLE